jgi:hypothetical protein
MDIHAILTDALRLHEAGTRDVHIVNHSSWETVGLARAVRDILARGRGRFSSGAAPGPLTLVFVDQRRNPGGRLAVPHARYGDAVRVVRITLCHPHACLESPLHRLVVAQSPRVLAPPAFHRDLAVAVVEAAGACDRHVRTDVEIHGGAAPLNGKAVGLPALLAVQRRSESCHARSSHLRGLVGAVDVSDEDHPRVTETRVALAHVAAVARLLHEDAERGAGDVARSLRVTEATLRL